MLLKLLLIFNILIYANSQTNCKKSQTIVNGQQVCSKEVIFEDNFNTFDDSKWKNSIRISSLVEEEFVVYDKKPENIFVEDGKLYIKPTLMPDNRVTSGEINFKTCTGNYGTAECQKTTAKFHAILPPIESAQITSRTFNFKYGIVEIRAKLPSGDWIVPQLWLEPKSQDYGPIFKSGRIIIASSNGNEELVQPDGEDIGRKRLKAGVIVGADNKAFGKSAFFRMKPDSEFQGWSADFHNYTFVWKPNSLAFSVDNKLKNIVEGKPLINSLKFNQEEIQANWESDSLIAPFDKEFILTLGVAVGSQRDFPDDITTKNNHPKPWMRTAVKKTLNFWQDRNNWYPTWNGRDAALQVDYVRVTAL